MTPTSFVSAGGLTRDRRADRLPRREHRCDAVFAWLQKVAIEQAPDHRRAALQLELDRLDRLQAAFWAMALAGDYHAAEVA